MPTFARSPPLEKRKRGKRGTGRDVIELPNRFHFQTWELFLSAFYFTSFDFLRNNYITSSNFEIGIIEVVSLRVIIYEECFFGRQA